jgi:hypothetical protein
MLQYLDTSIVILWWAFVLLGSFAVVFQPQHRDALAHRVRPRLSLRNGYAGFSILRSAEAGTEF